MMTIIIIFWIVYSVMTYGICFAYFQREYPLLAKEEYYVDMIKCIIFSILGPLSLVSLILAVRISGGDVLKHGFKFY